MLFSAGIQALLRDDKTCAWGSRYQQLQNMRAPDNIPIASDEDTARRRPIYLSTCEPLHHARDAQPRRTYLPCCRQVASRTRSTCRVCDAPSRDALSGGVSIIDRRRRVAGGGMMMSWELDNDDV